MCWTCKCEQALRFEQFRIAGVSKGYDWLSDSPLAALGMLRGKSSVHKRKTFCGVVQVGSECRLQTNVNGIVGQGEREKRVAGHGMQLLKFRNGYQWTVQTEKAGGSALWCLPFLVLVCMRCEFFSNATPTSQESVLAYPWRYSCSSDTGEFSDKEWIQSSWDESNWLPLKV